MVAVQLVRGSYSAMIGSFFLFEQRFVQFGQFGLHHLGFADVHDVVRLVGVELVGLRLDVFVFAEAERIFLDVDIGFFVVDDNQAVDLVFMRPTVEIRPIGFAGCAHHFGHLQTQQRETNQHVNPGKTEAWHTIASFFPARIVVIVFAFETFFIFLFHIFFVRRGSGREAQRFYFLNSEGLPACAFNLLKH